MTMRPECQNGNECSDPGSQYCRCAQANTFSTYSKKDEKSFDLAELLKDAEFCAGLSEWEENFLNDLRGRLLLGNGEMRLTDRQMVVLRRIEAKVYVAG
jgi:hypothetical protein